MFSCRNASWGWSRGVAVVVVVVGVGLARLVGLFWAAPAGGQWGNTVLKDKNSSQ
jgi:hypothetical protein